MEMLKSVSLLAMLLTISSHAVVYEDAENGNTEGWRITDNTPVASISNVLTNGNRVIDLQGNGRENFFILGGKNDEAQKWDSQSESKILKWKMKFDSRYYVYVHVETASGEVRRIRYSSSRDHEVKNGMLRISLGNDSDDGAWVSVERDLEADLKTLLPDDTIVAVNGFEVQGSGMVDDISYGDADLNNNNNVDGWKLFPSGSNISNELSSNNGVIEFQETGYFLLGGTNASNGWNNSTQKTISWRMNFDRRYYIYVYVTTASGEINQIRYSSSRDFEINHAHIRIPLGVESDDGAWVNVERDLDADLKSLLPNDSIVAVHGILVQTTSDAGMIDDITLLGEGGEDNNNPLLLTTQTPHLHSNCLGYIEKSGLDSNGNGVLDASEVTETNPIYTEGTPLTRDQLQTMLANGDDVTAVNTCEITDMSGDLNTLLGFIPADFNQDISAWNTGSVVNMSLMFALTKEFDQDIGDWNTSSVVDMSFAFALAEKFNQDIGRWDVSRVTSMWGTFYQTHLFNQNISGWNTGSVLNMEGTFMDSLSFTNQDLSSWDVHAVESHKDFAKNWGAANIEPNWIDVFNYSVEHYNDNENTAVVHFVFAAWDPTFKLFVDNTEKALDSGSINDGYITLSNGRHEFKACDANDNTNCSYVFTVDVYKSFEIDAYKKIAINEKSNGMTNNGTDIIYGSISGKIYTLDVDTENSELLHDVGTKVSGLVHLDTDNYYYSSINTQEIKHLNTDTDSEALIANVSFPDGIDIYKNRLYSVSHDKSGVLSIFDLDGNQVGSLDTKISDMVGIAHTDNFLYVLSEDGHIYQVDSTTGHLAKVFNNNNKFSSGNASLGLEAITIINNKIYVSYIDDTSIYMIDVDISQYE